MNKKEITYIQLKDGNLTVKTTSDFKMIMKQEFKDGRFDTTDYLFEEDKDIRVFVEDESIYTLPESVYFFYGTELAHIFHGTVLLAKMGVNSFRSLSNKSIRIITSRLEVNNDQTFSIFD